MRPKHPSNAAGLGLAVVLSVVLVPSAAQAYCRTSVCEGGVAGQQCNPPQPGDCGIELYWPKSCIGYSLQEDGSARVSLEEASSIVALSFQAWEDAACAGGNPSIEAQDLGPVECGAREYNQMGGNASVVVFRDDEWPYANTGNTLALTTVTFNLESGEIYDADLEVNGTVELTTGEPVQYDLLSILTHEAGHFLGLAHSEDITATMYVEYLPSTTELRSLEPDDIAAICDAYPPDSPHGSCDPTPRHGFKSTCGPGTEEEEGGCCAFRAPGRSRGTSALVLALAGLGLFGLRRRR